MRIARLALPAASLLLLGACATTRMSDPQELALYQGHASAPVRWVRYVEPIGWERIDNFHLVVADRDDGPVPGLGQRRPGDLHQP